TRTSAPPQRRKKNRAYRIFPISRASAAGWSRIVTVSDLPTIDPVIELALVRRLTRLWPVGGLDRVGNYVARLWRQAAQIMWALEAKICHGLCAPALRNVIDSKGFFGGDFPRRRPQPAQPLNTYGGLLRFLPRSCKPEGMATGDESSACWARVVSN